MPIAPQNGVLDDKSPGTMHRQMLSLIATCIYCRAAQRADSEGLLLQTMLQLLPCKFDNCRIHAAPSQVFSIFRGRKEDRGDGLAAKRGRDES